ncbi:MAG: pyridine nucleotide-disulfide oxidoreductase [Myxococcales bacterium]|nr:pyridine nucleotide-disulfide oxidoreductase [Myxococcales bacterium]
MIVQPAAPTFGGHTFADLFDPACLRDLHATWEQAVADADPALHARYLAHRGGEPLGPEAFSTLLTDLAPHVGVHVARLFGVTAERDAARAATASALGLFRFKDEFVKRRASKRKVAPDAHAEVVARGGAVLERLGLARPHHNVEERVAATVCHLLDHEAKLKQRPVDDPDLVAVREDLAALEQWVMARQPVLGRTWISYRQPHHLDYQNLVALRRPDERLPELIAGPVATLRARDGFKLTDRRMEPREVMGEVTYCLYCHDRDKDSCSKGLTDAKTSAIKTNPLGIPLEGCPLDEKISEMHLVRRHGDVIAALALACIDNPMIAGTGHRICNDCMKACVFQKQEPVNIPQIETAVLTDVLALPWGFEIYGLLTRWNPLHFARPYPLPYNGKNVLVVGLGPAGYTLAHHLLNEGFGVVGIDGLKIEPPPAALLENPVRDYRSIETDLDERILAGFGGVSEYGITVRWDKNFLTVLHVILARREKLRMYGGVRFGGTLTLEDAWGLGFHHVAIAAGAGKPTLIDLENNLIRGVRKASDFLMGLQLTGAQKRSSLANLQVRLPAVVIGGGLTAIDTCTELLAYYVVQVEKTLARYDGLCAAKPEHEVRHAWDPEERVALDEALAHGRAIRAERALAAAEGRPPNFNALLDSWGGATIAYRKKITDSPAYRLNHEEILKGLEEGMRFVEKMAPKAAIPDEHGALRAVTFERQAEENGKWRGTGEIVELPARTLCVAAGTSPNTIYEKERPGTFQLDRKGFFAPHRATRQADGTVRLDPDASGFFTSYHSDGRTVSYYGDNHPRFAGSVVKAMASAKYGYRAVADLLLDGEAPADAAMQQAREATWSDLAATLTDALTATVHEVIRLTPNIIEVVVRAPLAAQKFRPGQFYRLQNYEVSSPIVEGTRLTMEGVALTGAWTDPEAGLLSLIILEMGASSRLCGHLVPGEPVVVMGPTGAPTEIPRGETVVLCGGGLGNAVLFSIGRAMREAGNRVVYFAGYKKPEDVYHRGDIEAAADQIVWSVDAGPKVEPILPRRPQDRHFVGNIVEAMHAYAQGRFGGEIATFAEVDRIIAIGSDRMMGAVQHAKRGLLGAFLRPNTIGVASINSPMQCMMKEVCAQCLQKHIDPKTGKETVVFTCFNQDQDLDAVDFKHLAARLRANTMQEKLTNLWLTHLLASRPVPDLPGPVDRAETCAL